MALQDLPYVRELDAVMTVDAMEHIPPDDWPLVLANVRRAVRPAPGGRGRAGQPAMATATGKVSAVIRAVTFWVPVLTSMTWPA